MPTNKTLKEKTPNGTKHWMEKCQLVQKVEEKKGWLGQNIEKQKTRNVTNIIWKKRQKQKCRLEILLTVKKHWNDKMLINKKRRLENCLTEKNSTMGRKGRIDILENWNILNFLKVRLNFFTIQHYVPFGVYYIQHYFLSTFFTFNFYYLLFYVLLSLFTI